MKYLSISLMVFATSAFAAERELQCGPNTELNPNNRFSHEVITTDIGDYKVVNDAATGLQWSYCLVGQTYDDLQDECLGSPSVPYEYGDDLNPNIRQATMEAVKSESQLLDALENSWRLPNIKELMSIYNDQCVPTYYPAFNYDINLSEDEIESLANTPNDFNSIEEYHEVMDAKSRGKVYQRLTISSDTALFDRDSMYYYTVEFIGWGSPMDQMRGIGGMLRLVREIPKQ